MITNFGIIILLSGWILFKFFDLFHVYFKLYLLNYSLNITKLPTLFYKF